MRKSYEMDMTRGPLLRSILLFMLPLLLSGVLQLLFNATDIVVVGQVRGRERDGGGRLDYLALQSAYQRLHRHFGWRERACRAVLRRAQL